MYNPAPFVEDRIDVLHELIRQYPLATIVTCGPSGPEATHVPVVLHADQGANGVLRCHLARANDHGKSFLKGSAVLAIFHGADHYITPSWYTTKQEHGKVVPTWNYYQLGTPDGTLSLAGLAINVPIADFGGAGRAQKTPYVPIAAAAKSAIEAVAAG